MTTTTAIDPSTAFPRPYPILSADSHVNQGPEVFATLPEDLLVHVPQLAERDGQLWFTTENGLPYPSLPQVLPDVWGDGRTHEIMKNREHSGIAARYEGRGIAGATVAGRMAEQARDGVEVEVLYPNIWPIYNCENPRYQAEVTRRYNDWLREWVRGHEYRFVPAAMVPLCFDQFDDSIRELTRARELGFVTATLPVGVPWLPYDQPDYEPLWSAFEDLGVVIAFHAGSGNNFVVADFANLGSVPPAYYEAWRQRRPEFAFHETPSMSVLGMAAGMSPVVHLTSSGVLERHPGLRFVVVESEIGWLGWILQQMDQMTHKRKAHMPTFKLDLLPSEYFKRQGWITFTEDTYGLAQLDFIGSDRVLWSSDYNHDEGTFLLSQETIAEMFRDISADVQRQLLWANAAELYGLDEQEVLAHRADA